MSKQKTPLHKPWSKMKPSLVFATYFIILLSFAGCNAAPEDKTTLGSHNLTIVDTSGKPLGGTSGTKRDDVAGITTDFFESANGRYNITLENEVMTVNGDNYTLDKQGSVIRIVGDQVEINGVDTSPDMKP